MIISWMMRGLASLRSVWPWRIRDLAWWPHLLFCRPGFSSSSLVVISSTSFSPNPPDDRVSSCNVYRRHNALPAAPAPPPPDPDHGPGVPGLTGAVRGQGPVPVLPGGGGPVPGSPTRHCGVRRDAAGSQVLGVQRGAAQGLLSSSNNSFTQWFVQKFQQVLPNLRQPSTEPAVCEKEGRAVPVLRLGTGSTHRI